MALTPARRVPGVLAVATLSLATALTAGARSTPPAYAVVLKSGEVVQATTRPLIALGKVSFLDGASRTRTLTVDAVDLAATRARLDGVRASHSRTWTADQLAKMQGGIQIVGESEPADGEAKPSSGSSDGNEENDLSTAAGIRLEIAKLEEQIKPLDPTDRRRTVLMMRQQELRQELQRIASPNARS